MNGRERTLTALNRQTPDRVPVTLFGEILMGYVPTIDEMFKEKCAPRTPREYFGLDITAIPRTPTRRPNDYSGYITADERTTIDEWGVGWRQGSRLHYHEMIHPLEKLEFDEIRRYPFPDLDADYRFAGARRDNNALQAEGLATASFAGSVFETAWYLRGMEQFLLDLMSGAEVSDFLLDRIADIVAGTARRLAAAGVDIVIVGDDIAMQKGLMMSIDMWRESVKPRLERVIRAAKEARPDVLILYHSDGDVWDAIPDLIDAGVDVLHPVQPECMDPARVKKAFGDRLSFLGTISVQQTLPRGTRDDIRNEVKTRIETVGRGGGFVIAPSHLLQPEQPWENIVAFFEAVEEFRDY